MPVHRATASRDTIVLYRYPISLLLSRWTSSSAEFPLVLLHKLIMWRSKRNKLLVVLLLLLPQEAGPLDFSRDTPTIKKEEGVDEEEADIIVVLPDGVSQSSTPLRCVYGVGDLRL